MIFLPVDFSHLFHIFNFYPVMQYACNFFQHAVIKKLLQAPFLHQDSGYCYLHRLAPGAKPHPYSCFYSSYFNNPFLGMIG